MELPGIEPGAEIVLNCGDPRFQHANRRESTRNDLRIRRKVLMASTPSAQACPATKRLLGLSYSAFVPSSCIDRTTRGLVTALGVVAWLKLPQVLLRTKGGLIHQALASLRRRGPRQREGSGVSG